MLNLRIIFGSLEAKMDIYRPHYRRSRRLAGLICALLIVGLASCAAPTVLETLPKPHEPPPSSPPGTKSVRSELPSIQYTIQVGAFSTVERAAVYAAGLIHRGLDAYYFIDADRLCKVRFERFDSKEEARRRAGELQDLGWIDDFYIAQPVSRQFHMDPQAVLRQSIVQTAGRFIGTPYRWGGESARSGFDCSGLTMTVYRLNGLELPRNSRAQFHSGTPVSKKDLLAGDLVFFATDGRKRVSHVGVYTGSGRFIHAPGQGKRIRFASLSNRYFNRHYAGARRYF